jgi:nucleoside-diphosphate-sugar epimerase
MSRTILVTGGSGFIGSYILRALAERGDQVINLDVREPGAEAAWLLKSSASALRFVQGGVDSLSSVVAAIKLYEPDAIIHAAAITNPVLLSKQPGLALKVMVEGSFNVLEAARIFGVPRVVYLSSIGVLPAVQYQPIDVNHPVLLATEGPGSSFYGAAKVSAEAFCWAYRQSFGLDFMILRPSAVYGFGMQWPLFIKPMVENSVRDLPTRFEKGREFPRDYTHAADVAQLAIKAVDLPAAQVKDRVFYGATGRPLVTAGQVADIVKELIAGADIEIGSGLSEADLLEIRYRGVLSIENAQAQLGYQPRFADIRDGIMDYIEVYRRYRAETKA